MQHCKLCGCLLEKRVNYVSLATFMMTKPANTIFKTAQLILFFFAAVSPWTTSKAQSHQEANTSSQARYETEIQQRLDSLMLAMPTGQVLKDSLLSALFEEYSQAYLNLGRAGEWKEALPLALACEATFVGHLKPKEAADLIYDIGYIYDKCQQYSSALDYFHHSIALYEAIHDVDKQDLRNDIALAYNNIGVVHANTGFFTERKESYLKAKALWESTVGVDKSNLISLYGNLLRLYLQYGDKQAAKELITAVNINFNQWVHEDRFESAQKGLVTEKPEPFYHVEKHRLNILYTDLISDKAGGLAHLDSLNKHFRAMNSDDQKRFSAYLLSAISHAVAPLVDYDDPAERLQKKRYLEMGMRESIRLEDRYNQMILHSRWVSYYLDAEQNMEKALFHLDQAIEIGHEMDIREFNLLNLYLKKAEVLQQTGRFPEAEKLVHSSMSILLGQPVSDPAVVQLDDFAHRNDIYYVNALRQAANLYKSEYIRGNAAYHKKLAMHFYDIAANLFHVYYQKGAYNPRLSMTNAAINEGLLALHIEGASMKATSLVNLIENNRSQHLAKEFEAKYQRFLQIPDSLFTQRNLLQAKIAELERSNRQTEKEYQALYTDLTDVEAKIQEADERHFSFFEQAFNIQEVQFALREEEYIVRYVVAEKNIYAYTLQRDSLSVHQLGSKDTLLTLTEQYHRTIKDKNHDYATTAVELYAALIEPLGLPLDQVEILVIIPDNKLNFLAFETLIHPESRRPLVTMCPISYSHGLRLWLLQRRSASSPPRNQYFAAFAPEYSTDYMQAFSGSHPASRDRLQDIAGATDEAVQLAQRLGGNLYRGAQATKHDFLQNATAYKVYHFAMHALLDESDHLQSSLVFQDEEPLRYNELYSMHFPAELVVLSACNTGVGNLESGEGLMSLSRALTYAGVRSSVYSLWEVPDEETGEIMLSFYDHLQAGHTKATALAFAKRDFLDNNPMKAHPFFWAGFVVNGNTDPLDSTEGSRSFLLWLIVGVLAAFAVLFLTRRSSNRPA